MSAYVGINLGIGIRDERETTGEPPSKSMAGGKKKHLGRVRERWVIDGV